MKDEPEKTRLAIAAYFLIQAIAVGLWWGLLWTIPSSASWFHPTAWPDESLFAFFFPDLFILIGGSLFASIVVWRAVSWAHLAAWSVAIAAWYPTLYCLGASVITDQAWFATACMTCMSGLSLVMATMIGVGNEQPQSIRANKLEKHSALFWTALQIAIFWSVFLWILPKGITELQSRFGISFFEHPMQIGLAATLFLLASILGLSSGLAMSVYGKGTPLPTATAPELVVRGPYRWVRNPMAIAGILQGIAVGWGMGSILVILYSIAGAFAWHFIARPAEEADLAERFGNTYQQYREQVPLWRPAVRGFEVE